VLSASSSFVLKVGNYESTRRHISEGSNFYTPCSENLASQLRIYPSLEISKNEQCLHYTNLGSKSGHMSTAFVFHVPFFSTCSIPDVNSAPHKYV
jgi:hypothetical protein